MTCDQLSKARPHAGLSLTEVLISMFVLSIGLMGVAAMFPVGSHYMAKGDQSDRGVAVAEAAMNEVLSRGLLDPRRWVVPDQNANVGSPFIGPEPLTGPKFREAIVIDPLGAAVEFRQGGTPRLARQFPPLGTNDFMMRVTLTPELYPFRPQDPFPQPQMPMMHPLVAREIFQSQDDLAFTLPDDGDEPARQTVVVHDRNNNITDNDSIADYVALKRSSIGDYSWIVTISPEYVRTSYLGGQLVPSLRADERTAARLNSRFNVSVAVFYKRVIEPAQPDASDVSERTVVAEPIGSGYGGGEFQLSVNGGQQSKWLENIDVGNWVMLVTPPATGPNRPPQQLHWYKVLATGSQPGASGHTTAPAVGANRFHRYVTLEGPNWDVKAYPKAVAVLLNDVIAVETRTVRLEGNSKWETPRASSIGVPQSL